MFFTPISLLLESIFVMAQNQIFYLRSLYFIPQGTAPCDVFHDCTMLVVMQLPCVAVKPRNVQITTLAAPLSAGKTQHLQCETWGSVPPARVIWLLDGEPLENAPTSVCIPSITFFSLSPCRGRGNKRNSLVTTHSTVHYTTVWHHATLTQWNPPVTQSKLSTSLYPEFTFGHVAKLPEFISSECVPINCTVILCCRINPFSK